IGWRVAVTQAHAEAALAVGLQCHAAIVYKRRLRDRGVTFPVRQLEGHRWRQPFSGPDFRDLLLDVNAFVVPFPIVAPDRAASGNDECGGFVWYCWLLPTRNSVAEGDAVIEGPSFQGVVRVTLQVGDGNSCSLAVIGGLRVDAVPWIGFLHLVSIRF